MHSLSVSEDGHFSVIPELSDVVVISCTEAKIINTFQNVFFTLKESYKRAFFKLTFFPKKCSEIT